MPPSLHAADHPDRLPPCRRRSNPLSDPPQPVRAGKDGTEIEPAVAEELLALLEKAAANPKPPAAAGAGASPARPPAAGEGGAPAGAVPPGGLVMPGMVGAGLMGMGDPFMMVSRLVTLCWDAGRLHA